MLPLWLILSLLVLPTVASEHSEVDEWIARYEAAAAEDKWTIAAALTDAIASDYPREVVDFYERIKADINSAPIDARLTILSDACWGLFASNNLSRAHSLCTESKALALAQRNNDAAAIINNVLSVIALENGDYAEGIRLGDEAIHLSSSARLRGVAQTNLGKHMVDLGSDDEALNRFRLALEEASRTELSDVDRAYVSSIAYFEMAQVMRREGDLNAAADYVQRAEKAARATGYRGEVALAYTLTTTIALDRDDLDTAQKYSLLALEMGDQLGALNVKAKARSARALTLLRLGNLDQALVMAEEAVALHGSESPQRNRHRSSMALAQVQMARGELSQALTTIDSAESNLVSLQEMGSLGELLKLKAEVLATMGNAQSAYTVLQEHVGLAEKSRLRDSSAHQSILRMQRQIEERNAELRDARQQKELATIVADRARLHTLASILAALVLLGAVFVFMMRRNQRRIAETERQVQAQLEQEVERQTSALRHQTAARAKLEADLLQRQKLDAIGQLTGGIAHDFNNLMTVVIGGTDMVIDSEDSQLSEDDLENLRSVQHAAESGADVTRQLLSFARKQSLNPSPTNLKTQLLELRRMLLRTFGDGIELELNLCDESLWSAVDRSQLSTALLNLGLNARDAMSGKGTISVRLSSESDSVPTKNLKTGQYCRIDVSDHGRGIPIDVQKRVFEPFFTTKDFSSGSGLGLSIVYGFVRQSQGDIEIQSKLHEGTQVTIWLPRCEEPALSSKTQQIVDVPLSTNKRILIVEDQSRVRELAARAIANLGYEVEVAKDGAQAKAIIGGEFPPDVVFTDIAMPGDCDGLELARWISERFNGSIQVVLTSGYHEYQTQNLEFDFISKPYTRHSLTAVLGRCA